MRLVEESWLYIEAVEAEVESIHRSHESSELPFDGVPTLSVQAFICGVRKEEEYQVFVALHSKSCKRNLIYSVAVEQKGKNGYDAALKGALEMCHGMGFTMEGVNLKCSTAMREVIIRNIPVLLTPAAARKAIAQKAEELAELERLSMQPEENEATEEAAGGLSPARRAARERTRQERLEEMKTAARRLAAETIADERAAATRKAVERLLAARFEVVGSKTASALVPSMAKEPAWRQHLPAVDAEAPVTEAVKPAVTAEQNRGETLEMQRLARELERLVVEKAAVELRVAELSATAQKAAEEADRERAERERLEMAKATAELRAQELAAATRQAELRAETERAERERLNAEKTAAELRAVELAEAAREAELRALALQEEQQRQTALQVERVQTERDQLLAEKAAAEQRAAAMVEAVREAEQRVEVERGEREQLLAAKAAAEQRVSELSEAVRLIESQATASRSEKELLALAQADRERAERERLTADKLAAEKRAAELAEAVRRAERQSAMERAERERLNAEKTAAEQRAAELAKAARRSAELSEIARQAALRAESERRERERLEAEKARVERRLQMQSEVVREGESMPAEKGRRREPLPSMGGLFASGGKVPEAPLPSSPKPTARPSVSGAFFQVDPELAEIAYDSADDVLEVQQSISMTQLSLEGLPNQYCMAYIIVLQKKLVRQVHVAFRLTSSDRVLVYSPASPPQDEKAYARAMQEASRFLRVTGIETETVPLGKSPQSRARALAQIPVLRFQSQDFRTS